MIIIITIIIILIFFIIILIVCNIYNIIDSIITNYNIKNIRWLHQELGFLDLVGI